MWSDQDGELPKINVRHRYRKLKKTVSRINAPQNLPQSIIFKLLKIKEKILVEARGSKNLLRTKDKNNIRYLLRNHAINESGMQYLKVLRHTHTQKPNQLKNSVSCEIIQKWRRNFFRQTSWVNSLPVDLPCKK